MFRGGLEGALDIIFTISLGNNYEKWRKTTFSNVNEVRKIQGRIPDFY